MSWMRKRKETTDHGYAEERLSAYLDGELSPQERQAVSQHLSACHACQWQLDTLRQTVQWTRELPTIPVPRVFTIPASVQPVPAPRQRRSVVPLLQGATAFIALLFVVVVASDFALTGVLPSGSGPVLGPQLEAAVEQAPADFLLDQEPEVVEKEVVRESEVAAKESVAEAAQAAAPQAALPAEQPPGQTSEGLQAEVAGTQAPEPTEAPLAMEAAVAPTSLPEAERMVGMGGGQEPVEQAAVAEKAEIPVTLEVEEAVAEGEPVAALVEPTPAATPTTTSTITPTVVPPPPSPVPQASPSPTLPAATASVVPTPITPPAADEPPLLGYLVEGDRGGETVAVPPRPVLLRQPVVIWLRLAEGALGAAFIILATVTVVAVLQRRRNR
jgi:anti-sigma factor RsiW